MQFIEKKDWEAVSLVKRFMEYESLVPGFAEEMEKDPEGTLKKYGLPLTPEDCSFNGLVETDENSRGHKMEARYPGSKAEAYANFMNKKIGHLDILREACVPENPAMKKWRERQMKRCCMELGGKVVHLVHSPFAIELASGCSIGCEFCGFNAGKLKEVYRYTEENAQLFRDVIRIAKEIIGPAAGQGTMYYATEPLDNPDYELFLKDYVDCFDELPQITTAASTRHIERLHKLLKELNERNDKIYRFSVTSPEMRDMIFKEFAPEELPLVELLPQFEGAPSNNFIKAGRNVKEDDEYGDTIACMSGFIVNMPTRSVKLTTPTWSSKEHPTGEIIIDVGHFETAEDFRNLILSMISKHMSNIIGPKEKLMLRKDLCYNINDEGKLIITTNKGVDYNFQKNKYSDLYMKMFDYVKEEPRTRREIVSFLRTQPGFEEGGTEALHFVVNRMWHLGALLTVSGTV